MSLHQSLNTTEISDYTSYKQIPKILRQSQCLVLDMIKIFGRVLFEGFFKPTKTHLEVDKGIFSSLRNFFAFFEF